MEPDCVLGDGLHAGPAGGYDFCVALGNEGVRAGAEARPPLGGGDCVDIVGAVRVAVVELVPIDVGEPQRWLVGLAEETTNRPAEDDGVGGQPAEDVLPKLVIGACRPLRGEVPAALASAQSVTPLHCAMSPTK